MNSMLQRHCAKYIYIVPDGLRELMSDISREVIRSYPDNMYTFIADYLDALMITRENARIAAKMVECISEIAETTVSLLREVGLNREEANRIVTIIQVHFRAFLARKKPKFEETEGELTEGQLFTQRILDELQIEHEKLDEIAVIIQTAYRKFKERKEREKQLLFGMVDWRIAARSAIALYKRTGVTHYEANRAASLIKAAYKGYYTRRIMRKLLEKGLETSEICSEEIETYESTLETDETIPSYLSFTIGEDEGELSDETQAMYLGGEQTVITEEVLLPTDNEPTPIIEDETTVYEVIGESEELKYDDETYGLATEVETEPLTEMTEMTEITDMTEATELTDTNEG